MGGFNITNVNLVDGIDVSVLDTAVVKLTGDQTIAGTKTFSNAITASLGIIANDKITTASGKPIIVGRTTKVIGATGGLELFGTFNDNTAGAHLQAITTEDNYPTFQLTNLAHNNINMTFDAYLDAGGWKSSYASSNFLISKWNNKLRFLYDSGGSVGGALGWNLALELDTAGLLTTKAITASGAITANGGLNMEGQSITNVNLVDGIDVSVLDTSVVKLTGNQTIAGIKTYSSGLEITGNSTNATTRGVFVVFNSTSNIGTIGCLNMSTGVNYNFELNAKKVSFVIDGAIVGWVNASGLDCNSSKIANLGTPTLATDGATKGYADTLDGQNVKLTGDQTITGIKIFNGTRNAIRALNLLGQADFNNVDIINGGNITYNGARILNQNGGDAFFSQTTGDWQSFLYTLNTASSGTADQRGYVFTNVAFDAKGAGLYISKLSDSKFMSSDIVRFNNAGGMKFYGALDMNSNNITSGGTITGTTITGTTITASTKITTATGKPIIIGNTTKGTGPSAGLEIYGAYGDFTAGPHIQAITTEDAYPLFTIANLGHNNIILAFDAYLDNAGWKSSYANANFRIAKVSNTLSFGYKSGIAVGSAITWSEAMNIDNTGLITANVGITTASGKPIIIGKATKGVGATGGLELYGTASDPAGPHIQAIVSTDAHPVFQMYNFAHDDINFGFDTYVSGGVWKSSSATSNFIIQKATNLTFRYKSGVSAGTTISTWGEAMNISSNGDLVIGAGKKIFVDRNAIANNKLVLWDGGTGSTTAFLGFGINNNTLIYNVNDVADSHVFYYGISTELFRINNTAITASKAITANAGISTTTLSTSGTITYSSSNNSVSLGPRTGALEPMILLKSSTNANNRGFFGYSGTTTYAWSTSNSSGENSGAYNYIPLNGAWTYSSDRRLKTDIKTLECGDCCEKLMKTNCCSYYLKSDEKKENKNCGFIADEVKKIFPEFVSDSGMKADDGGENLEGITYTSFIPILISAFQHLSEQNKILSNDIADLKKQLAEINAS